MRVGSQVLQFDWDQGNITKNERKHGVKAWECEEAFFDSRKVMLKDSLHSGMEPRYIILGKTKKQRLLFIVFTVRSRSVRVISARDVTKRKEIDLYEQAA